MKKIVIMVLVLASTAGAVQIEWVTVGNPGNPPDTEVMLTDGTTGYGAVEYTYQIGKFEITTAQYTEFLNAVAMDDTYGLYTEDMIGKYGCQIERSGEPGSYSYSIAAELANHPVNCTTWGNALRFSNWLTNGQPMGAQDLSTTEDGSYYLDGANTQEALISITRKADACYVIPTEDEWYKAAYHKNDGVTGHYFDYPTSSNVAPGNQLIDPDPGNNANFNTSVFTDVGAFENSTSPYGTFDQGGSVYEWNETIIGGSVRPFVRRGGSFRNELARLHAAYRHWDSLLGGNRVGFRVAEVPEPATPPVADADGPYSIYVGDSLILDASGSTDDNNDIVSYIWDLNDDETFETDAGSQAIFDVNYTYLQSLGLLINNTYTIHLKVTDSEGQSDVADSTLIIIPKPATIVAVDIKPGSCPNPVNVKSSGVLPIAILGTSDYDVTTIDPTSIRLSGVEPLRSGYEDVATPVSDGNDCNCITDGPDGFLDLTLKFKTQRIVEAVGDVNDGDVRVLTLTGVLFDPMPFETPIEGADCILIRGRHKPINRADINKDGVVNAADFAIIAENWLQSSIVQD